MVKGQAWKNDVHFERKDRYEKIYLYWCETAIKTTNKLLDSKIQQVKKPVEFLNTCCCISYNDSA